MPTVVVGTRGSKLARRQTDLVVGLLSAAWPGLRCDVRPVVTEGDRTQESGRPLPEIGGKGLFTEALEQGIRDGELDLAVHSLKDLPTVEAEEVVVGAVCLREDPRDCLVSRDGLELAALPAGAVVGTSSLRRIAQLRVSRSDLELQTIRGNVDTRIGKVRSGEYDATVLAAAGVTRLGLQEEVSEWLAAETMLPAPGQGAIAVQCRAGDVRALELIGAIDDGVARAATTAERSFLQELGGGCAAPVAAYAESVAAAAPSDNLSQGEMRVRLEGLVLSLDGVQAVRVSGEGASDEIGERLARDAIARGARQILDEIRG